MQSLGLGDAEIHQLDLARTVDVHVVGLDIPVDDLPGVNVFERAGDIERDAQPVGHIAGMVVADGVAEVLAHQEFHHDERAALLFAVIVNADDVLVLDVAGHARFLKETRLGFGVLAGLGREDFDGHLPADGGIPRAVDVGHSAAQEFQQLVLANVGGKVHGGSTGPPARRSANYSGNLSGTRAPRRRYPPGTDR